MTETEKKRKRYIRGVRWRLNLPKDVKGRVMSDFVSSISARAEAGLTDAQIYAELGSPRKAAADLNEQMREYAYRRSPWRFVFLAMAAVSGGWLVLSRLVMWLKRCDHRCGLLSDRNHFGGHHRRRRRPYSDFCDGEKQLSLGYFPDAPAAGDRRDRLSLSAQMQKKALIWKEPFLIPLNVDAL